ncbi:putative exportin-5 [Powai lake megavirus]|uniref:Putative exportin-5 n=1 Tax=Powai lake megavirus TaxID=1842663 RepID=A0A167R5Z7_9VIRU|nr:putative exportin-5 [Powai lake megavirus]ANB50347.1 putative exportin-5 [Powai lake megavirus]
MLRRLELGTMRVTQIHLELDVFKLSVGEFERDASSGVSLRCILGNTRTSNAVLDKELSELYAREFEIDVVEVLDSRNEVAVVSALAVNNRLAKTVLNLAQILQHLFRQVLVGCYQIIGDVESVSENVLVSVVEHLDLLEDLAGHETTLTVHKFLMSLIKIDDEAMSLR